MLHFIQNCLLYCGIYSVIGGIWKLYEVIRQKEITPHKRDTFIALGLAAVLWFIVRI